MHPNPCVIKIFHLVPHLHTPPCPLGEMSVVYSVGDGSVSALVQAEIDVFIQQIPMMGREWLINKQPVIDEFKRFIGKIGKIENGKASFDESAFFTIRRLNMEYMDMEDCLSEEEKNSVRY